SSDAARAERTSIHITKSQIGSDDRYGAAAATTRIHVSGRQVVKINGSACRNGDPTPLSIVLSNVDIPNRDIGRAGRINVDDVCVARQIAEHVDAIDDSTGAGNRLHDRI